MSRGIPAVDPKLATLNRALITKLNSQFQEFILQSNWFAEEHGSHPKKYIDMIEFSSFLRSYKCLGAKT